LDATHDAELLGNLFQDSGTGVSGVDDTGTFVSSGLSRRNVTGIELDGSSESMLSFNRSEDDETFLLTLVTDAVQVAFNDVAGVTDAGLVMLNDDEMRIDGFAVSGDGDGVRLAADGGGGISNLEIAGSDFHDLGGSGVTI